MLVYMHIYIAHLYRCHLSLNFYLQSEILNDRATSMAYHFTKTELKLAFELESKYIFNFMWV